MTTEPHNFKILLFLLNGYHHTQRYCYPCITFSLHNFKRLRICHLEFLGLVILLFFGDFWETVSIIVNIVSNITVLQCYLLWIFVSIRRLHQLIMYIGVSTLPHLKNMTPSFAKSPLTSANYPSPPLIKKYFIHQPPFAVMNNVFSK